MFQPVNEEIGMPQIVDWKLWQYLVVRQRRYIQSTVPPSTQSWKEWVPVPCTITGNPLTPLMPPPEGQNSSSSFASDTITQFTPISMTSGTLSVSAIK